MAKRKLKKAKKTSRKISRRFLRSTTSNQRFPAERFDNFNIVKLLFNLIFIAVIIFGIYIIWTLDWLQGIGIIFAALFIYLLIKLISNLRKK